MITGARELLCSATSLSPSLATAKQWRTAVSTSFDAIAAAYSILAPAQQRWAREGGFLTAWAGNARSLLDVGCGAGAHSAALASNGRQVLGIDPSPAMIASARCSYADTPQLHFMIADAAHPPPGPWERIMCIGNTLNLLASRQAVAQALAALVGTLSREGSLLLHLLSPVQDRHMITRQGLVQGRHLRVEKTLAPGHLQVCVYDDKSDCQLAQIDHPMLDLSEDEVSALLADLGLRIEMRSSLSLETPGNDIVCIAWQDD